MAKDFLNKEISAGDTVVFIIPNYRQLEKATISKVTNKMVVLERPRRGMDPDTFRQFHNQVVKIDNV